jgi:membrane protein implicated in regulation of membrane protease activity
MIGKMVTITQMGNRTSAFLDGAWWEVKGRGSDLKAGAVAKVVAIEGISLVVEEVGDGVR